MARFTVNDVVRAILRRPALAAEVAATLVAGGSFSIVDDRLVSLDEISTPPRPFA
jgi:hypothetical protein